MEAEDPSDVVPGISWTCGSCNKDFSTIDAWKEHVRACSDALEEKRIEDEKLRLIRKHTSACTACRSHVFLVQAIREAFEVGRDYPHAR